MLRDALGAILSAAPDPVGGEAIGTSREGRPIHGHRAGTGPLRISLIGGCHADEPVGPRLLAHLAAWLTGLPPDHSAVRDHWWWIIPHVNPDGAERNRPWQHPDADAYDLIAFLRGQVREPPGDDIEFGFPRDEGDDGARPEPRAAAAWWRAAGAPFHLHASMHGMGFAAGPWYLVEQAWAGRLDPLVARCHQDAAALGYDIHDIDRQGEKGFTRLARGFTTRPNSVAMRQHFLAAGDPETASRIRPSSMEYVRSLGGDPLTMVSEMPLFLTPGVGKTLGPPDPVGEAWKERIAAWRAAVAAGEDERVRREAAETGCRPMPVGDQMALQWAFLCAGIALARAAGTSP